MYGLQLEASVADHTEGWARAAYGRVSADSLDPDNPVREFDSYYRTLAEGGLPRWDQFDICAVPSRVVAHIALGQPAYTRDGSGKPDHFVYTLQGGAVRALLGTSVIGQKVGHVMQYSITYSLRAEIAEAVESGRAILSRSDIAKGERPAMQISRGLFLFAGTDRPIGKLVLVLGKRYVD
jgi:hypothetical protein